MNTNKQIVALSCGVLDPSKPDIEMIFIGSTTNLLVYDCTNNSDVFDKEVNDGLLCICPSPPNNCIGADEPLVLIGGNSSITGFDM